MELVDIPAELLQVGSLSEEVEEKWCLVMFITFEDPKGRKSVSSPIYIGLLADNQLVLTDEDIHTHLKAEWAKPAAESNIVVTLSKSLLQTPKFADLDVARKVIKVLTRVLDWDHWPAEVARDLPSRRPDEKIAGVKVVPLQISLKFDLEHGLDIGMQTSIEDMVADIEGLDNRLLVSDFGQA